MWPGQEQRNRDAQSGRMPPGRQPGGSSQSPNQSPQMPAGRMWLTFLAILEMIRLKLLRVFQSGTGGPIRVYKRDRPADAPRPIEHHEPAARPHGTSGSQS